MVRLNVKEDDLFGVSSNGRHTFWKHGILGLFSIYFYTSEIIFNTTRNGINVCVCIATLIFAVFFLFFFCYCYLLLVLVVISFFSFHLISCIYLYFYRRTHFTSRGVYFMYNSFIFTLSSYSLHFHFIFINQNWIYISFYTLLTYIYLYNFCFHI